MSLMTKFLKQKCKFTQCQRNEAGEPIRDEYGEPMFMEPINLSCRCERITKDVLTTNGSVIKSTSRYFLDTSYDVQVGDLLDGRPISSVSDFINAQGVSEGYECYV